MKGIREINNELEWVNMGSGEQTEILFRYTIDKSDIEIILSGT